MSRTIYFVHGNGFPSPCYRQFLENLAPNYQYAWIDRVGHNPHYPVTENWHFLIHEIVEDLEKKALGPVIGMGHSLGGALSCFAAMERPDLFEQVIMLDSPLVNPLKSWMIKMAKTFGFIEKVTPAAQTKGRRTHWNTREELLAYLKSRPLFQTFDERCLQDFIEFGCEQREDGFHLRFDRDVEYSIYLTIPHSRKKLSSELTVPTRLIYGVNSNVVTALDRLYMRRSHGIQGFALPGTHMFPFEIPEMAARKVIEVLEEN